MECFLQITRQCLNSNTWGREGKEEGLGFRKSLRSAAYPETMALDNHTGSSKANGPLQLSPVED